jgi:ribonuclease R
MNRRPNTAPPQEQSPQRDTFSREIRREAASLIERIPEVLQGRPMIQGLTINGPSSKDLDDALWLEAQADGVCQHCRCGCTAEADTDTCTASEALKRVFTRYFASGTNPMLPRSLSEDALSLLEGQPRPAITLCLPFNAQMEPGEARIEFTALSSRKRMSYLFVGDYYCLSSSFTIYRWMKLDRERVFKRQ